MYKCRECNKEFKHKVDYCDCGNDIFEYIEDKKPLSLETKSEIVSWIFFVICMIFSIIILLIPIKNELPQKAPEQKVPAVKNIPDINKFWDDTPIQQEISEQNTVDEPVEIIIYEPRPKISEQKPIISQQKPKPEPKANSQKNQNLPKAQNLPKSQNPPKAQPEPKEQKAKIQHEQVQPKANTKPAYNPNDPQMLRYKANLRAYMFSKFAVGAIQGSGECSVQFSVDKSGKLVNRKFTHESDNKALNDTVYYMLMSVPKFSTPPEIYNGEPISMNFKIYNGSYEISIY